MTAMAQPLSGLDASHVDAMDFLSDAGYDGVDGDIDIDFGPVDGDERIDDAISLQDAAVEGEVEPQAAPTDADDFMVDKDDLIEEDEIEYGDLELEDADHPSADAQTEAAGQTDVAPISNSNQDVEEDLIDYSDDEDQQAEVVPNTGSQAQDMQEGNTAAETVTEVDNSAETAPTGTAASAHDEWDNGYEQAGEEIEQELDAPEQPWDGDEASAKWEQQSNLQHEQTSHAEPDGSTDDQQPAIVYQEQDKPASSHQSERESEARQANEHPSEFQVRHDDDDDFEAKNEDPGSAQAEQPSRLHPVTVNYDGTELWLFKTDDSDDGEWLLADESIATQPFHYLFHACRAQLGDDLSSETEIGIRFDNFRGLVLFEDCTACAYSTLKEFVDIYTTLHAQDGQTDPEPLYVTLQFRPRVLTLVGELKKAVQDQLGFTGLENAIAAGQTSFSNTYEQHSDAFEEQWSNDGGEGAEAERNEEEAGDDNVAHSDEPNHDADAIHARGHSAATSSAASSAAEGAHVTVTEPTPQDVNLSTGGKADHASVTGAHDGEDTQDDDFIDYSDDEGEEDAGQAGRTPAQEASSCSSTVQGDEPSHDHYATQEPTNESKRHDGDRQSNPDYAAEGEADRNTHATIGVEEEATSAQYNQDSVSNDPRNAVDDGFVEAYDPDLESGDYSGQTFGPEGHDDYYGDDSNADLGQQNDPSLINETEDPNESGTYQDTFVDAEDAFGGADDFVELAAAEVFNDDPSGVTENVIDDEIYYDDEEEAPGQDETVAVSVSVPPSVASSTGLDDQGSPQGQKRPHDEIDGGFDGASDTTGRFGHDNYKHTMGADIVYPDTKRPKL
jgi:hypothetical protein